MADEERPSRVELAQDRTHLAEDRTMLANERTFSGWARTVLAAIGIGVGFNALFEAMNPTWVPRGVATLFVLMGVMVIVMAERRACRISARLTAHQINETPVLPLRLIALAICLGAAALIAAIWVLY